LTGSLTGLQARRRRSTETATRPPRDARVCGLASEGHAEARGDSAAPIWAPELAPSNLTTTLNSGQLANPSYGSPYAARNSSRGPYTHCDDYWMVEEDGGDQS
jgi:hypothetical protein